MLFVGHIYTTADGIFFISIYQQTVNTGSAIDIVKRLCIFVYFQCFSLNTQNIQRKHTQI